MYLPVEIWNKIYEYDPTYHREYHVRLMDELRATQFADMYPDTDVAIGLGYSIYRGAVLFTQLVIVGMVFLMYVLAAQLVFIYMDGM